MVNKEDLREKDYNMTELIKTLNKQHMDRLAEVHSLGTALDERTEEIRYCVPSSHLSSTLLYSSLLFSPFHFNFSSFNCLGLA